MEPSPTSLSSKSTDITPVPVVRADTPARALLSTLQEPLIVLVWLTRLRWLAVLGQVIAMGLAAIVLSIQLPLLPVSIVVLTTLLTNLVVRFWILRGDPPAGLVPVVLFLDVGLLTVLLFFTGGPANPFATLYVVHVVMAVVLLGPLWAWTLVVVAGASYALLFRFHIPLTAEPAVSPRVLAAGNWAALVLESALIAYFISRLSRSLRDREAELRTMRDRATRHQQLASLATLAAGAAHELGTPLGTIAVVAKELELAIGRSGQNDPDAAEDARLIRREVDRCRKILDRMRVDVVQDIAAQSRVLGVGELVELVKSDMTEETLSRLTVSTATEVRAVIAPPRAVQQALGVMIRNAFDASPDGARVMLDIRRRESSVLISVVDEGTGMAADVVRRAGEPFFTTKAPGRGMGLGLFLVRLVAEQCNGRWYIESTPGRGTKSVLELPASG
ncbi:MAG TPA: ATP-binding protein [Tepidisphaeraceae bacterium]|nr:ATP-binding protein [Tepidisphaeraceae bacterium]